MKIREILQNIFIIIFVYELFTFSPDQTAKCTINIPLNFMYDIITSARLSFRLGVPFGESRNSCDFFANTGGYGGKRTIFLANMAIIF